MKNCLKIKLCNAAIAMSSEYCNEYDVYTRTEHQKSLVLVGEQSLTFVESSC